MDRTLNILTIVFQLAMTFTLTVCIYMIFALLDSDFGFDGLVGLLIFQPILGALFSFLTILVCLIVGLPIRLIKKVKNWWTANFYISIIGTVCGLTLLFLSLTHYFTETVKIQMDGQETLRQVPNLFLSYSGWFLTAFSTLHLFPPDKLLNWIKKIIPTFKTS